MHQEWALGEWQRVSWCSSLRNMLLDFGRRSFNKSEQLGDTAVDAQRYDEAISYYSLALSLNLPSPKDVLVKRIKACVAIGSWEQAADDANQVDRCCVIQVNIVDTTSSGNHIRSVFAMGLRDEVYSFTEDRRLRQCSRGARADALETSPVPRSKHSTWVVSTLSR